MSDYQIKIITTADKSRILSFVQEYFYKHEPLNQYLYGLKGGEINCEDRCIQGINAIDHELSLMALTSNNEVIGVCINENQKDFIFSDYHPNLLKIYKIVKKLEEDAKLLKLENPDDLEISVKIMVVDPRWGGKGIGSELIKRTIELAVDKGYRQIRAVCTSAYSARIFEKLGFQCANSIKYEDYKEDGEIVFKPNLPHTHLKALVLKFPN